jgi:uncharacterized protein YndB with AHSA1/START domain
MREAIVRNVELDATPARVWRAITRPEQLAAWFGADAEVDPTPGGTVRFRWPDGEERRGVVEVAEAPRRFTFRWRTIARRGGSVEVGDVSRVQFVLEAIPGGGTRLRVSEEPGIVGADAIGDVSARGSGAPSSGRPRASLLAPSSGRPGAARLLASG